jgi:hypothetical protein
LCIADAHKAAAVMDLVKLLLRVPRKKGNIGAKHG